MRNAIVPPPQHRIYRLCVCVCVWSPLAGAVLLTSILPPPFFLLYKEPKAALNTISNLQSIHCVDERERERCCVRRARALTLQQLFVSFISFSPRFFGRSFIVYFTTLNPGKCMTNCKKDARSEWELSERIALQQNFASEGWSGRLTVMAQVASKPHIRGDGIVMARTAAARPTNRNGIFPQFRHVDIKRLQFFFFLCTYRLDPSVLTFDPNVARSHRVLLLMLWYMLAAVFAQDRTILFLFFLSLQPHVVSLHTPLHSNVYCECEH